MASEKTLVLGSGVSALAYLYYNVNACALAGEQVGGLFAQAQNLGPQYIWKTLSTTKLLADMGYIGTGVKDSRVTVQRVRIGYLWWGRITRLEDLDLSTRQEIRRLYALKTRGIAPETSHMSDGKSEFEIYSLPVDELVAELLKRVSLRLIHQKAQTIDLYNQIVRSDVPYEYDKLVSTIPAPVFLKLTGNESEVPRLRAFDKAYEKDTIRFQFEEAVARARGDAGNKSAVDYVYVPEDGYAFHRVRFLPDGKVVREFTLTDGSTYSGTGLLQKKGQIVGGHEVLESLPKDSVECLGRYAEWKHGIRLEDVLDSIQ